MPPFLRLPLSIILFVCLIRSSTGPGPRLLIALSAVPLSHSLSLSVCLPLPCAGTAAQSARLSVLIVIMLLIRTVQSGAALFSFSFTFSFSRTLLPLFKFASPFSVVLFYLVLWLSHSKIYLRPGESYSNLQIVLTWVLTHTRMFVSAFCFRHFSCFICQNCPKFRSNSNAALLQIQF